MLTKKTLKKALLNTRIKQKANFYRVTCQKSLNSKELLKL